jgi:hypothetical protein
LCDDLVHEIAGHETSEDPEAYAIRESIVRFIGDVS